MVITTQVTTVT